MGKNGIGSPLNGCGITKGQRAPQDGAPCKIAGAKLLLGCGQEVRHRNLDPKIKGSSPFTPVSR